MVPDPHFYSRFFLSFFPGDPLALFARDYGDETFCSQYYFCCSDRLYANLAFPRAGEVAKCTVLAKYEKLPAHKMIGTIVAERAFDILCLLIIALIAYILQAHKINAYLVDNPKHLARGIERHRNLLIIIALVLTALILGIILFYRRHRDNKVGRFMKEISHGILSIIHMKKRWEFLGYTCPYMVNVPFTNIYRA